MQKEECKKDKEQLENIKCSNERSDKLYIMGVDYGDKNGDVIYGWIPPNVNCRDKYGVERCRDPCPADRRFMQECIILYQLVQHASWTSVLPSFWRMR
jgi:hypothetical protein